MKKLLLVEDSEMFYHLLTKALKRVDVKWAMDGKDALLKVREVQPDIMLVDVVLPDMSGIDLIKKIKDIHPNAKIIVISGIDHDEVRRDALRAGAVDYISKSAGLNYLRERIYREIED